MKTIYTLLSLMLLTSTTILGQTQKNTGKLNTTFYKTFTREKDGTEIQYRLKVMEHRQYPIKLDTNDEELINQNREYTAAKVMKLVAVDNDNDNQYEQYFVLKYRKSITDEFEVIVTDKGFAVKVDDAFLRLFERDGIYFIENTDQDFFTVEEFREIG